MISQWRTVGEKIKATRKGAKMTLKTLAGKTGLSISYLSDIERDRTDPSLKTLTKLADAFGTTPSGLLHGTILK